MQGQVEMMWSSSVKKAPAARATTILFIFILFFGVYMYSLCIDNSVTNILARTSRASNEGVPTSPKNPTIPKKNHPKRPVVPFNCSDTKLKRTCPTNFPEEDSFSSSSSSTVCPDYFRWIHEDLRPWRETGITLDMVMRANRTANFRLVILNGKPYVEMYKKSFHSRDISTLWGIVQLLRRYPGKLPDLDLMFDCLDWPAIKISDYEGPNATSPPPLFCYSGNNSTLDIVFPDWSFWGWHEINIKPWNILSEEIKEGNRRTKWIDRDPHAYWKGNPTVAPTRKDLMKCNASEKQDWNARLYAQNWKTETQKGFQQSNLANQCTHRYKIYIEGQAWSVSEKYILACDSLTLLVKPIYYDFFTRSLVPLRHYWPIKENDKCRSIKFAVDWGNNNKQKVQEMGKAASNFILEDLKMDYVYDYMFHLLSEYAKLMRYTPTIPPKAVELCSETMACAANGLAREYMMESMVQTPRDIGPCTMPPPFDSSTFQALVKEKEASTNEVEMWGKKFWENQSK